MILSDTPTRNATLIEFFIIHVCALSGEVRADSMGGASAFIAVPFRGIVLADPVDNVIRFLVRSSVRMTFFQSENRAITNQWPVVVTI